jgi:peptidoglycan hydrolase-like protein with peptidoglycan-binding domain
MADKATPKSRDEKPTVIYILYAAAAYFGIQMLTRSKAVAASVVSLPQQRESIPVAQTTPPNQAAAPAGRKQSPWTTESFPLKRGMKGGHVAELQRKLGISADGVFGAKTEAAVLAKQGTRTVTKEQFNQMMPGEQQQTNTDRKAANVDASLVLKVGSQGRSVYRLQKWLGFKDRQQAKKGEPVADGIFGKQTEAALQKKMGQPGISTGHLDTLIRQGSGLLSWLKR